MSKSLRKHSGAFKYKVAAAIKGDETVAVMLSNTLDVHFCLEALEEALEKQKPDIFNVDQGAQFTSTKFTGMLLDHGVKISMDGKGRFIDNIFVERLWRGLKYEEVYLKAYETIAEAKAGIASYMAFYNHEMGLPHRLGGA